MEKNIHDLRQVLYNYFDCVHSPDGELLASQGGDPDFMLTVWNWRQEKITLRTKSFSQDVFRVSFAPELEGQLTTAGTGHIRYKYFTPALYITPSAIKY